jgi:hypothetical protein
MGAGVAVGDAPGDGDGALMTIDCASTEVAAEPKPVTFT